MMRQKLSLCFVSSLLAIAPLKASTLPKYQKVAGVSGNLSSVGSDTLSGMTTLWLEEFKSLYPNVNAQIQASGSATAPPALAEGTAQFGPMSRVMRMREVEAFEREHGYKPTALRVAIDAIGVFVHMDNPVTGLNFEQLDSLFSSTMRCGAKQPIDSWSQLGIEASWGQRSVQLFGRNSVSGTYGYFKRNALCGGDFNRSVNEQPGSASVVQAVSSSINSVGYSGIGYRVSGTRLLPVAREGKDYIYPSDENVLSGAYPLSRYLYIYVNKNPNQPLEPIEEAYIRFIFSMEGQRIVQSDGYVPVSYEFAQSELNKVGLE
jgi:phosphate transport system substrate-binding protein